MKKLLILIAGAGLWLAGYHYGRNPDKANLVDWAASKAQSLGDSQTAGQDLSQRLSSVGKHLSDMFNNDAGQQNPRDAIAQADPEANEQEVHEAGSAKQSPANLSARQTSNRDIPTCW